MADKNLKVLSGRLKSLKGWLSRTVSACDYLVSAPRSLGSDSFLKSRIEKSSQELDDRLQQIYDCVGELEASKLTLYYMRGTLCARTCRQSIMNPQWMPQLSSFS